MSVVSRAENLQQTSTHTNERRKARNERSQEETRTEATQDIFNVGQTHGTM